MRKMLVIGTASVCVLVWSAVIIVYLLTPPQTFEANDHGLVSNSGGLLKEKKVSSFFEKIDENKKLLSQSETIIGPVNISKAWTKDIEKDGKLSIDTLLETLDIEE
ncbi:hypothetical protein SAMN05216353_15114 [Halobacillus alkaliphilus]|uniref:Uncharacterized protein n=1 Tax=Halobacillus alkaliphilus TaxID=396056 RepID=A0A1I2SI74_9BACI|nr:hypothetical protein [Halobacillus alkaliphilus]SFG52203.1 hypothetical protein SAMN05216353_15114 [Halobacillus alkaliphilus]